mmetsp:Transcript_30093/g.82659  ORF Transcript_30093/g.82659 Transcript_30093/m.82659 type:complete len:167 (-) Transcript_30093:1277-1777(-)
MALDRPGRKDAAPTGPRQGPSEHGAVVGAGGRSARGGCRRVAPRPGPAGNGRKVQYGLWPFARASRGMDATATTTSANPRWGPDDEVGSTCFVELRFGPVPMLSELEYHFWVQPKGTVWRKRALQVYTVSTVFFRQPQTIECDFVSATQRLPNVPLGQRSYIPTLL